MRRDSRITRAQKVALVDNWVRYALPDCGDGADLANAFGHRAALTLEIGSGDGTCVHDLARRRPEENFIAVEVYRPGLGRLLNRAAADGLSNIRVSDRDVCELLVAYTEAVFDRVLIFFPDPWPKKRHHKRRLLQDEFFGLLAPRLHRHGRVFVATDCAGYAESIMDTIEMLPAWVNLAGPRRSAPRPRFRPTTKFERRAIAAGSRIVDFVFALR